MEETAEKQAVEEAKQEFKAEESVADTTISISPVLKKPRGALPPSSKGWCEVEGYSCNPYVEMKVAFIVSLNRWCIPI
jgi:hypothetical protein